MKVLAALQSEKLASAPFVRALHVTVVPADHGIAIVYDCAVVMPVMLVHVEPPLVE